MTKGTVTQEFTRLLHFVVSCYTRTRRVSTGLCKLPPPFEEMTGQDPAPGHGGLPMEDGRRKGNVV